MAGEAELAALLGDPVQQVRRLEQRLGRDAAAVEAGAAQLVALDQPDLQAKLCGADGADIAHPAAQDQEVELLGIGHALARGRSSARPSCATSSPRQSSGTGIGFDVLVVEGDQDR